MNIFCLLLLLLPTSRGASQGPVFRLKEKSPEGFVVVENLGQFLGNGLPSTSSDKTTQVLAIGNIETPGADFFKIDRDTGNLVVKVPPDRDAICSSTKKQSYTAIDRADNTIELVPKQTSYGINAAFEVDDSCPIKLSIFHGPQSDPQHDVIIILLEDINDHVPNFDHVSANDKSARIPFEYEVHVKELRSTMGDAASELAKIRIPLPTAKDSDSGSNGIVYYRLEGPDSYLFKLSAIMQEGQDLNLFLIPKLVHNSYLSGEENQLSRILDRETREEYRMILVVEDGGTPPKSGRLNIRLVIDDINDSRPTFLQDRYAAGMSEDDPSGHAVLHFAAVDHDSYKDNKMVNFRIPQAKLDSNDDTLNAISQRAAFNLFELEVDHPNLRSAYDTKNITKGKLLIRKLSVEDRVKAVKEAIANAKSTQTLEGIERIFSFCIEAYDHGSPELSSITQVEISIKSVNSEKPTIVIYYINKQEPDDPRLSKLGQVWGIVNENQDRIMLAQVTVIDPDAINTAPSDDLRCVVSDDRFSLEEIVSASSQHSSKQGIRKMFKLMSITRLDRENVAGGTQLSGQLVQDRFQFVIKCVDNFHALLPGGQKTSTAEVRVQIGDHNDNSPKFERPKYVFRVLENRPDLTRSFDGGYSERFYLGSVHAIDLDSGENSQLEYKLTTNTHGALEIDPKNGSLYVIRPFDRELIPQVELQVLAIDNPKDNLGVRLTGSASVVVHVDDANDCVPQFRQSSYHFYVPENKDMLKIGQVIADDNDENEAGRLSYRLSAPQGNGLASIGNYFQVDSQTGIIRLRKRLDREERLNYEFNVLAIDNPQASFTNSEKVIDKDILKQNTGTTTVLVTVTDDNDNPPQISSPRNQEEFFVPVSQLNAGTTIFNIKASDADFEDNAIIKYSIIPIGITGPAKHSNSSKNETDEKSDMHVSGEFPINCDELIGTCYLNRSIPTDFDLPVTYTFRVKAYDLGRTTSLNTSVIVKVTLGAEDPKSSGFSLGSGNGFFTDPNGRNRWNGRSMMVIIAAAFVLLLLFAVFLLLLLRFRGNFMQTFLFPSRHRRPRKDEGYTSGECQIRCFITFAMSHRKREDNLIV
ncbi:Origin recognition complex subunit 2 [Cichlidogyrus casuarinus]|uniref:Origin recognition complex subunit 2 n=1 Tax=Cichlidogyrus casuarinus TaxID=1844966 RepID=A0ABD2QQ39_9PLAT